MFGKYNIVLFKNNKKKKLIKSYATEKSAIKKFNTLLDKNKDILFDKKVENAENCNFYLSIITNQEKIQKSIVLKDELGRNIPVILDNPDYVVLEMKPYKKEELIYDWQTKNKISLNDLLITYCKPKELKNIFTINNKLCIQINEDVYAFSLKDKHDSDRLLHIIENLFIDTNRTDAIFVRDVSSSQRKWVYQLLGDKGFDKKHLYRLKTTFSKR